MTLNIDKVNQKISEAKRHLENLEKEKKLLSSLEGVTPTYDIEKLLLHGDDSIGFHNLRYLPEILHHLYDGKTFLVKHGAFSAIATIRFNGQSNRVIIGEYIPQSDTRIWLTEDNWMKYATHYPTQWFLQD